ncbi:MAG TPA: outer membrane beta-barrel protein [Pyrinomonadaceae bacterium]|nr:outer membrane beta-barrel protein [Pyrinomonadaceae bacterium]
MRKLLFSVIVMACAATLSYAQTDYNKVDIFAGFSHNRVDTGISNNEPELDDVIDEREGFNGFNASVTGNVTRYLGIKGDYSFHRKSFSNSFGGVTAAVDADVHQLFGGVQFKDNSKETKVKPFAHLMAGFARGKSDATVTGIPGFTSFEETETGFAGIIGGGVDIKISPRVDFRAIQFDYNPTRLGDSTQHNFRIGIGIVFR